jgi:biotin carboxylase
MPMRSLAAATTKLNIPGISIETAIKATDKGEMIKAFKEKHVESPEYCIVESEFELQQVIYKFSLPVILKPTDNSGSRGVVIVKTITEIKEAFNYSFNLSRSGKVIVEEFMEGNEVSVEVMVVNEIVNVLAVTDKLTTSAPYFVEVGHNQPSLIDSNNIERIKDLTCRAIQAIGIKNGPVHVEIMLTKRGPKMIELGARMGGDCISTHLVPLSTGIDMIKATIDVSLGKKPDISSIFHKGSAIRYFTTQAGTISSISGLDDAKRLHGIKEIIFTKNVGDKIKTIQSSVDRIGFIIAQGTDAEEAINICELARNQINIEIKSE